jgi:EmrB/QacA subfamily drug resistance transporter
MAAPASAYAAPPVPHLTQQEKTFTLIGVFLGVLLAALDQTIVATAGPSIQVDLKIPASLFVWVTTAYVVASTVMVPIYGKLSDLFGRKLILLVGIAIFLLGSLLSGLSTQTWEIIAARAVQGLGSAALFTTALAVIADIFPPAERGKYSGLFGAVFGISSVVGPLVGGFLTDNFSWHWVFFVNLPVGAVAVAFIVAKMPRLNHSTSKPSIDYLGAVALLTSLIPLLLALSLGKTTVNPGDTGFLWGSPEIIGMFVLAAVALIAFVAIESRAKDPLVDMRLFGIRTFSIANLAAFVIGMGFFGAIIFLPIFMQNVVGLSATESGFAGLPLVIGLVIGNILSGQLVSRFGRYKPLMLVGLAIMTVGFAIAGFTLTPQSTFWEVFLKMLILGLGLGPSIPLYTLAVQNAVSPEKIGVATSAATFFRSMGSTVGLAIFFSIFGNYLATNLPTAISSATSDLPATMREQFSGSQGGGLSSEGSGNSLRFDTNAIKQQATAAVSKSFDEFEANLTKAIRDNDPAAVKAVLANPQTPAQLRTVLEAGGVAASVKAGFDAQYKAIAGVIQSGQPAAWTALVANPQLPAALRQNLSRIPAAAIQNPQAKAGILAQIKTSMAAAQATAISGATNAALEGATTGIEQARTTVLAQVSTTVDKVGVAFKQTLTDGITSIYKIGIFVSILAFLITLALPELPLRKTSRYSAPVAE